MYDGLKFLFEGVARTSQPPDNAVKIAIITAISVVLAAAITAFATAFTNRRIGEAYVEDYAEGLVRRAEVAEHQVVVLEAQRESLSTRVDELERYCWQAGIDPDTGKLAARLNGAPVSDSSVED